MREISFTVECISYCTSAQATERYTELQYGFSSQCSALKKYNMHLQIGNTSLVFTGLWHTCILSYAVLR